MPDIFTLLIVRPMGFIIEFIYNVIPNYGVAIILFTIIIKLLLLPLNLKQQRSMAKQQKLAPMLQEIQRKYANDKEKLNKEMMELYRANGANPASGCLPLLLQFPIIIGLFQVIQKPLSYMLRIDFNAAENINRVINLQQIVAGNEALKALVPAGFIESDMATLANNFQIAMSNIAANPMVEGFRDWVIDFNFLGLNLSGYPSEFGGPFFSLLAGQYSDALLTTLPLLIIPVLAGVTSWLLGKMTPQTGAAASNASSNGTADTAASMNKSMLLMMPLMSVFFTFTMPAGVGLYWIISNVVTIIQQYFTLKYYKKKEENALVVNTIKENRKDRKKHRRSH